MQIKYGESFPKSSSKKQNPAKKNSHDHGNRLYRQIGHASSFKEKKLKGSCGSDWLDLEKQFYLKYGFALDHTDLLIEIRDFGNYPFKSVDPKRELFYAEQELIRMHAKLYGGLPIGNLTVCSDKWVKDNDLYVSNDLYNLYIA